MSTSKQQTNSESTYVRIIKEICNENNIDWKSFSYDWVFQLTKNDRTRYLIGYQFDLNTSAIQAICKDKSAASAVLMSHGIPCVEHSFFMCPTNAEYLGLSGSWLLMKNIKDTNAKIVCKPNEGTGGHDIFVVSNQKELEYAVDHIFKNSRSMAISPYYNIQEEYRVIFLNDQIKLFFSKQRPFVTGDGLSTLIKLLCEYIESNKIDDIDIELGERTYQTILKKGEVFSFNWKHNLGQGASAVILEDENTKNHLVPLVLETAQAFHLQFASIDIIKADDMYRVLEVHCGVMMEYFPSQNDEYYNITKKIYKEAIDLMFE